MPKTHLKKIENIFTPHDLLFCGVQFREDNKGYALHKVWYRLIDLNIR